MRFDGDLVAPDDLERLLKYAIREASLRKSPVLIFTAA